MKRRIISSFIMLAMAFMISSGCSLQGKQGLITGINDSATQTASQSNGNTLESKYLSTVSFMNERKVSSAEEALTAIKEIQSKNYYLNMTTADTIYYIKADGLGYQDCITAMSLQGIVAQQKSEIFLYYKFLEPWFQALQKYYNIKMVEVKSVWELVNKFKSHLRDNGFVRYHYYNSKDTEYNLDHPEAYGSCNIATMISGVYQYLMIDDSQIETAKSNGLVQKADALDYFSQLDAFDALQDKLNKNIMTSIEVVQPTLRDITIAEKMACWRDKDLSELAIITSTLGKNGIIMGWHDNETNGVNMGATTGWSTVASDWGSNYTVYAGLKKSPLIQKPNAQYENKNSKNVHYVTFMLSDGDNIQFISNSFINNSKYFGSSKRGTIPFGWTLSPTLAEFGQVFPKTLYDNATINDEFVASVSGMGYMYPSVFAADQLDEYINRTATYMKAMNERYVQIVDWYQDMVTEADTKRVREAYGKNSYIKGAFVYPVDNHYLYKKQAGSITWSNNKPFVATRESLWLDDNMISVENKNQAISKMAYRINHYKRDPSVIEGYTVVNVHPWSFSYDDVVNMVSLFDDQVVVVTPSELMALIQKNVAKKDVLELNDIKSFDYKDMKVFKDQTTSSVKDLVATEKTKFTFDKDTEGWQLAPNAQALDQIRLSAYDSGNGVAKLGILMAGSHFGTAKTIANAYMYNKIKIPSNVTKLAVSYTADAAKLRLKELKDDGSEVIISNYVDCKDNKAVKEFDISSLAGKTATLCLEFSDGNTNGTTIMIREIELR